jgi:hypothetical protein
MWVPVTWSWASHVTGRGSAGGDVRCVMGLIPHSVPCPEASRKTDHNPDISGYSNWRE